MSHIRIRLQIFVIALVAVIIVGTFGFMAIEGKSLADSFYFSVVTVATVGYGDILPVTTAGKVLAMILIVIGVGIFLGVVANATELMLSRREYRQRMEKLNMVIGVFFSEMGTRLLTMFSTADPAIERFRNDLIVENDWMEEDFRKVGAALKNYDYRLVPEKLDLGELRAFLLGKREFLIRLLENPVILEHENFTELLRSVFHIAEELHYRADTAGLPASDISHIINDVKRAYRVLIVQWLDYMQHLKTNYPYLFSLAMRTNPFDRQASPIVKGSDRVN